MPVSPQLTLCILPKLLLQPPIPRISTPLALDPYRLIIRPIDQVSLLRSRGPRLIERTALRTTKMTGNQEEKESVEPQPRFKEYVRAEGGKEVCENDTGVDGDRCYGGVPLSEFTCEEKVAEF